MFDQLLMWLQTAPLDSRCRATSALVRSYLVSDVSPDERDEMEAAMTLLLDDPAPEIQIELARALADERHAPRHIILALAEGPEAVSSLVLARSPVLIEAELVDFLAEGVPAAQCAIASRAWLSPGLSAAIAEVGTVEALVTLAGNATASIPVFSLAKMVERHGSDGRLREALLERAHLPIEIRHQVMTALSQSLAELVIDRNWMRSDRAAMTSEEARDKSTVQMAATAGAGELAEFVEHLRSSGQLTTTLLLRAATLGDVRFLLEALTLLTGLPRRRVEGLIVEGRESACRALFEKAGLPARVFPAFLAALDVQRELASEQGQHMPGYSEHHRFASRVVERVLAKCTASASDDQRDLIVLLRRLATEAQRDAARMLAAAVGRRPPLMLAPPEAYPEAEMDYAADDDAFEGYVESEEGFAPEYGAAFAIEASPEDAWSVRPPMVAFDDDQLARGFENELYLMPTMPPAQPAYQIPPVHAERRAA